METPAARTGLAGITARAISSPRFILAVTIAHLVIGASADILWLSTGDPWWVNTFFNYQGALFFLGMASLEFTLCLHISRQFDSHEELATAWTLIALSAACSTLGLFFAQILGRESLLNPLFVLGGPGEMIGDLREFGILVSSPLRMVVLAQGLFLVLRVYKRLDLLVRRLTLLDYVLFGLVGLYATVHVVEVIRIYHEPAPLHRIIGWISDPLLTILMLEAVFLRNSVAEAGWGLISKCWGAFCAAIFITTLGDVGIWAEWQGFLPPPFQSITWYIWFPASAAYALGPVYQVEALRTARYGLRSR